MLISASDLVNMAQRLVMIGASDLVNVAHRLVIISAPDLGTEVEDNQCI